MKKWLCSLASEFLEGLADGTLILFGGSAVAQYGAETLPRVPPMQALCTVLLAGVWYVAAFIKKNPPPFGEVAAPAPAVPPTPAS